MKISNPFIGLVVLLFISCSDNDNDDFPIDNDCLQGQGAIVSETRTLADFHSINTTIVADIFLAQGPKEDVIIEAQPNILQELKTEVVNGELRLTFNHCVDILQRVKVHITMPEIRNLTLTGVGDIMAQNQFNLTDLEVTLTGVGDIMLRGTSTTLDITLTGIGTVKAFGLDSEVCGVNITGVGDVEVLVNDMLNVTIAGVGNVFYKGNPSIASTITGSGGIVDSN